MKRILSFALALILIASLFVVAVPTSAESAVWDGTAASAFAGGDGSKATPYLISTPAEWAYFAAQVTGGTTYSGKYIKLIADLVFNTGDAFGWKETAPANTTPSVGTDSKPFSGTFDGQGHTVSGFYMNSTKDGTAVFGECKGASISNLIVANTLIQCKQWAGILVGEASGSVTIANCYIAQSAILSSSSGSVGGFIGGCYGAWASSDVAQITDSVFAGTIKANGSYVGGFIGNGNSSSGKIHKNILVNCLTIGTLDVAQGFVCGFIGGNGSTETNWADDLATFTGCIYAAGATGYNAGGSNSYPYTQIGKSGAVVTGCYSNVSGNNYKASDANTSGGVDNSVTLKNLWGTDASVTITGWTKRAGDIMIPTGVASFAPASGLADPYAAPSWLANYETETSFYISTVEQWNELSKFIAGDYATSGDFAGKNVVLAADLVFNTGNASGWGSKAPANKVPSLGSDGRPFRGTFDGQSDDGKTNYVISGVYMNSTADGTGLFGEIGEGAIIRNVTLVNSYFKCAEWAGALVGEISGGSTVKNCYVGSDVYVSASKGSVGGIVGGCYGQWGNSAKLDINNCVFAGTVTAKESYVGGILGNSNYNPDNPMKLHTVIVENCLNTGTVQGKNMVAGIAVGPHLLTINKCVNTGLVKTIVSGTGSWYADIWSGNCCVDDPVEGASEGIPRVVTVTDCYYLNSVGLYNDGGTVGPGVGTLTATGNVRVSLADLIGTGATAPSGWKKTTGELAYPAGVAKNKALVSTPLFTLGLENGASVKLDSVTGLRFTAVISNTYLASLDVSEYGIIIAPTLFVEEKANGVFTVEALEGITVEEGSLKYLQIPAEKFLKQTDDYTVYSGVIGTIKPENYSFEFSAIAYVKLNDGTMVYSSYDPTVNSRSVVHIARLAHEDVTEGPSVEYNTAVDVEGSSAKLYSPYSSADRTVLEGFYRNEKEIRVLQQNLLRDESTERERSARFLKEVAQYDPDVILLQEVDKEGEWWNNALSKLTETYTIVGVDEDTFYHRPIWDDYPNAPATYITVVMYRTERFDEAESALFWLTNDYTNKKETFEVTAVDSDEVEKNGTYQQNNLRTATYVILSDKNNANASFVAASIHFSTNNSEYKSGTKFTDKSVVGGEIRKQEATIVLNYLNGKANGAPILIAGDVNDSSSSPANEYYKSEGFMTTYEGTPINVGERRNSKTDNRGHIDWCFYDAEAFDTVSYHVIMDQYQSTNGTQGYVSDHCGIISDVVMK